MGTLICLPKIKKLFLLSYIIFIFSFVFPSFAQSLNQSNLTSFGNFSDINNDFVEKEKVLSPEQLLLKQRYVDKEYNKITFLEKLYSERTNENLELKGYSFFKDNFYFQNQKNFNVPGSIQKNYVLNVGDEIIFVLQGGRNESFRKKIQKDGNVYLDFTEPISVVGRTLGDVTKEIVSRTKSSLTETNIYLSLGNIKQLSVTITGEVISPGFYKVHPFSSLLDALLLSGGIKKTGTLRNIKILEGENVTDVDLYDFLFASTNQTSFSKLIQNNAIIIIPPIGETVALTGGFLNNGIYELSNKQNKLRDLVKIAGNYKKPGKFKLTKIPIIDEKNKKSNKTQISQGAILNNGDIINSYSDEQRVNSIQIVGAVKNPGIYPYNDFNQLSDVIPSTRFLNDNSYNFSFIIQRFDDKSFRNEFFVKSLIPFLTGNEDIQLSSGDKVFIFHKSDIDFLSSDLMRDVFLNRGTYSCNVIQKFSDILYQRISSNNDYLSFLVDYFENIKIQETKKDDLSLKKFEQQIIIESNQKQQFEDLEEKNILKESQTCLNIPEVFSLNENLLFAIYENIKIIDGDVKYPGIHLVSDNMISKELLSYVGSKSNNIRVSIDKKFIDVGLNSITISGALNRESIVKTKKKDLFLSSIINTKRDYNDQTHPFFGVILRKTKVSGFQKIVPFNPSLVNSGIKDIRLESGDNVKFFEVDDINFAVNNIKDLKTENFINENNSIQGKNIVVNDNKNNKTNNENFIGTSLLDESLKEEILLATNSLEEKNNETILSDVSDNNTYTNNSTTTENISIPYSMICANFDEWISQSQSTCKKFVDILKEFSVSIEGKVKSPGYYVIGDFVELKDLINFAGGFSLDADISNIEISNIQEHSNKFKLKRIVYPGGKVFVNELSNYENDLVLEGAFKKERSINYKINIKLSTILNSYKNLTEDAYLFFGTIERNNLNYKNRNLIPFSPYDVIEGFQDYRMNPGDKIRIYEKDEIEKLINEYSKIDNLKTPLLDFDNENNMPLISGDIVKLVKSLTLRIEGAVVNSGEIIIASKLTLRKVFEIMGGLTNDAMNMVEITFPEKDENKNFILKSEKFEFNDQKLVSYRISPGSLIRVSKVKNDLSLGYVQIKGAVLQPGNYRILSGDSIFDVIKRSNGLKESAYLKGMVFTRANEKEREKNSIKRMKRELEKAVLVALENQSSSNRINFSDISALRELILSANQFEPIGRVIGNFDNLETLKQTKVVSGDKIFIPNKPNSVTVIGEVMSPGSIIWLATNKSNDYINQAAGFTELAETKNVFVISPNGQASRKGNLWSSSNDILPGSTIVVPRRIKLASTIDMISSITSVIYQLTITLAGVDNLLNN